MRLPRPMSSPLASAANAAGKPQVVKKKREAQIEKDSGDEAEEWLREFFDRRGDEAAHETSAGAASAKAPPARSPKRSPRSMLSRRRRGVSAMRARSVRAPSFWGAWSALAALPRSRLGRRRWRRRRQASLLAQFGR